MNKNIVRVVAIALLVFLPVAMLAGCTAKPTTPPPPSTTTAPKPPPATTAPPAPKPSPAVSPAPKTSAPAPAAGVLTITYLGGVPMDTLVSQGQVKFKQMVEERSKGSIKVELYPNGQLYAHEKLTEAMQMGAASMAVGDPSGAAAVAPAFMGNLMPFAFDNLDHLLRYLDKVSPILDSELNRVNIKLIGWNYYGESGIISKAPITTQASLSGKKLRGKGEIEQRVLGALGATLVVLSSAEVYTALQRGTIDGAYSTTSTFVGRKWYEPCKNAILGPNNTSFLPASAFPVTWHTAKWNALPSTTKDIITKASDEIFKWQLVESVKVYQGELDDMKKAGVTIYNIPQAEWPNWTKASKAGWDYIVERDKENGAALVKAVEATRKP